MCVLCVLVCCVWNYINILYIYRFFFLSHTLILSEGFREIHCCPVCIYRNRDNIKIDPGSAHKKGRGAARRGEGRREKALSQTFPWHSPADTPQLTLKQVRRGVHNLDITHTTHTLNTVSLSIYRNYSWLQHSNTHANQCSAETSPVHPFNRNKSRATQQTNKSVVNGLEKKKKKWW